MSTIVGCVAGICSAYLDARKLVQDLRKRRHARPAFPDAEDLHCEALATSLDKGKTAVKSQYDHCIAQIGSVFARGDEEACRQLREITLQLQQQLVQPLKFAWQEDCSIDLLGLQDLSSESQDRAVFCLLELHQRMLLGPTQQSFSPHQSMSSGSSAILDVALSQEHWPSPRPRLDTSSYNSSTFQPDRTPSLTSATTMSPHLATSPPPQRALPSPPSTASEHDDVTSPELDKKKPPRRNGFFRRNKKPEIEEVDRDPTPVPPLPPLPTPPATAPFLTTTTAGRPSTSPHPGRAVPTPGYSPFPPDLMRPESKSSNHTSIVRDQQENGLTTLNTQATDLTLTRSADDRSRNVSMNAQSPLPQPLFSSPKITSPIVRSPLQNSESFIVPGAHQREYLPSEKNNYQGLCKAAWRLQTGQQKKAMKVRNRLMTAAGRQTIAYWSCADCDFEGKLVKIGKEERVDATVNSVSAQMDDGQIFTVRWRWGFLFRSHFVLKSAGGWDAHKTALQRAKFGCVFCCALGLQMHPLTGVKALVEHLVAEHIGQGRWPKDEVLYRMNCIVGERAPEGAEWDLNMIATSIR